MNTIKNLIKNNFRNMELDEYLRNELKDAGYGGVEVQKTPIGTRITLYATRPGLVIGRKGSGIKSLTTNMEQKFGLNNPQISVAEVQVPELNPKIMSNRIAQLVERGTAFRRASIWSMNTIMNAGAMGVEITVAGKLRSERSHFEKHSLGMVPKSGNVADKIVQIGLTHVLTKMGLMGIQVKIALKDSLHQEFKYIDEEKDEKLDNVVNEQVLDDLGEPLIENGEEVNLTTDSIISNNNDNNSYYGNEHSRRRPWFELPDRARRVTSRLRVSGGSAALPSGRRDPGGRSAAVSGTARRRSCACRRGGRRSAGPCRARAPWRWWRRSSWSRSRRRRDTPPGTCARGADRADPPRSGRSPSAPRRRGRAASGENRGCARPCRPPRCA